MDLRAVQDVVIVGAGAAGLVAAIFAARGGVSTTLVETRAEPGAKIRVSGGGRCNILPSLIDVKDFHTDGSLNTLRNILFSWPLVEVRAFFEDDLKVPLKVESTGKLFPCSDRSKDVVAALLGECARLGVVLRAPFRVKKLQQFNDEAKPCFRLESVEGMELYASHVVLATGGKSLAKSGSDGAGLELARALGHQVSPTYPALVPLLGAADQNWRSLSGVSVTVRLSVFQGAQRLDSRVGDLLFTHRGFSGPVVLDGSHHVTRSNHRDTRVEIHWAADQVPDWGALLKNGGARTVLSILRQHLPKRLAIALLADPGDVQSQRAGEMPRPLREKLVERLEHFPLPVTGNEGYKTAEVTGGGVLLSNVVAQSLESRCVPGLYFCGEILDATGRLGGYNFLWAWVTGRKVGNALASGSPGH